MPLPWALEGSERLMDCKVFGLHRKVFRSPRTGKPHDFFVLQGVDWVNTIAITSRDEIVFVEQFRQATGEPSIEIPGGMVDPIDRQPADAARRELLEETGYDAQAFLHLLTVRPNPAILNNCCHTYLALGATAQRPPKQDEGEDLTVRLIPAGSVPRLIAGGEIHHALVIAAFYAFERWRSGNWSLPLPAGRA
jgi:ADP-ribose pyrophosphatase